MNLQRILFAGASVTALMILPLTATAGHGGKGRVKQACSADAARLCGGLEGRGLRACMKDRSDQVSPACRDAVKEARAHREGDGKGKRKGHRKALAQACRADADRLCGGLQGGELRACMKEHRDEVSPECSAAVKKGDKRRPRHAAARKACGEDIQQYCGDVERGDRKACVQRHLGDFSPSCRETLDTLRERRRQDPAD